MTLAEFEQARAKRKQASERVAALLQQAPRIIHAYGMDGLRARGIRMENCGSFYAGDVCPVCHTFHPTAGSRCRDRLCPNCGWVLAIERSTAARRAIESLGNRYAIFHVVLTMRDPVAADGAMLHDQCRRLVDAYAKLVHNNKFKSMVWGTIRSLEISNNGASRYHPHIHALFVRKLHTPPVGRMMNHDELCTMWQKALEVDYRPVTWIERIFYIDEAADGSKVTLYDPADTESETASMAVIDKAVASSSQHLLHLLLGRHRKPS